MYWSLKRAIKGELIKSKYSLDDIKKLIPQIMKQNGYDVEIQNAIYQLHKNASANTKYYSDYDENNCDPPEISQLDEPLTCVRESRLSWAAFLQEQILSISHQLNRPLIV
jgi:hypothetical protein